MGWVKASKVASNLLTRCRVVSPASSLGTYVIGRSCRLAGSTQRLSTWSQSGERQTHSVVGWSEGRESFGHDVPSQNLQAAVR